MTDQPTAARRIVEAFGDCEALAAMYTDDIIWRLSYSLPPNIAGPHEGIEAVKGFNEAVFDKIYDSSTLSVDILDEIGTGSSSVVRFYLHATSHRGHSYDVEYVLFAKTRDDGLVYEVVELLDTLASTDQHQGKATGVAPNLGDSTV